MSRFDHPEDIKCALRKQYGSVFAFERQQALPMGGVRDALRGKSSRRVIEAIADALDVEVYDLKLSLKMSESRVHDVARSIPKSGKNSKLKVNAAEAA